MFLKHNEHVYMDLSAELRDSDDWKVGPLRTFDYPLNITSLAIEPISSLLALGTAGGQIYLFGGPGVESKLTLPESVGVRFVQFATSTFRLVCLDNNNLLHIWDLASYGRPKFVNSVRFDETNCLTLSPSHTHAFLALNSGEVRTYDLTCLRKSPYTIPNMWRFREEKLMASGIPDVSHPESRVCVETVIHPRDLNLLFVAYAGGVILSDLTQRDAIRAFELVLPPGARGGFGYASHDLLTHRRPSVTTLAVHPAGHFFVVGHADGSLAFWAVEDEDHPILVRTLDEVDIHIVDSQALDEHLSRKDKKNSFHPNREPIFKVSWSGFPNSTDPRGGDTVLTILGGLKMGEAVGLSVFRFPAFNPQEPPTSVAPGSQVPLHPFMRNAMRDSLTPSKSFFYYTQGIIQDYLLVPRQSPHFSGAFDPMAILLLLESEGDTRVVEAYQYPPPGFLTTTEEVATDAAATTILEDDRDPSDRLASDLASTLKSLQMDDEPRRLRLPTPLLNGSSGLLDGQLIELERETYQTLVSDGVADDLSLPLKGGLAWADEAKASELKMSKYQPHRVVITHHVDLTIQFLDISAQLLIGLRPTPIQHSFPNILPDLTIDLKPLLMDPFVSKRTSPTFVNHARIDSVHFATESLEVVAVLRTGELVVYRLLPDTRNAALYREASDEELIILEHITTHPAGRYSPYVMLSPSKGPIDACAISDIGFVAVAYEDGTLFILDLRGPTVILRHTQNTLAKNKHRHLIRTDSPGSITSLVWAVSPLEKDSQPRLRLVALYESGLCQIYTVGQVSGSTSWHCNGPVTAEGVANPLARGSFVLDSRSGKKWSANRARLAASLRPAAGAETHAVFVTSGTRGARCISNINGERISKVDWGAKVGTIQGVQIVEKLGSHVLVALTDRHDALVYSLPHLEFLHSLKLPPVPSLPLTLDESGDFIAWTPHPLSGTIHQSTYNTLFDIRRVYEAPDIDLLGTKPIVSAQPQPVSVGPASLLSSWFTFGQSMTGTQLDTLLGGPNRPIPGPPPQLQKATSGQSRLVDTSGIAAAAAATQSNLYNRLTSALEERGQMLGDLEERFNSLEEGSKGMVAQAKRLAAQQTTKSWFGL